MPHSFFVLERSFETLQPFKALVNHTWCENVERSCGEKLLFVRIFAQFPLFIFLLVPRVKTVTSFSRLKMMDAAFTGHFNKTFTIVWPFFKRVHIFSFSFTEEICLFTWWAGKIFDIWNCSWLCSKLRKTPLVLSWFTPWRLVSIYFLGKCQSDQGLS